MTTDFLKLEQEVIQILKNVYDPEIPVNVYDLGLIYKIDIDDNNNIEITMTLTAPNCPIADQVVEEVRQKVSEHPDLNNVTVNLVFEPSWSADMMSDEAKLVLGYL